MLLFTQQPGACAMHYLLSFEKKLTQTKAIWGFLKSPQIAWDILPRVNKSSEQMVDIYDKLDGEPHRIGDQYFWSKKIVLRVNDKRL